MCLISISKAENELYPITSQRNYNFVKNHHKLNVAITDMY
uniref:Uncharacterized protein n=1 Tax=Rhizophora mucronata TaxID=61149 RepID=A0A2P2QRT4_RHIMU